MDATVNSYEEAGRAMLQRALGDERQEFGNFFLLRLLGFEVSDGELVAHATATWKQLDPKRG